LETIKEKFMQPITVELPDHLAAKFASVCLENKRVQREVVSELVVRYLEDIEDMMDAERILAEGGERIPLEAIERKYGLAD
jgi:metal-responsive CopG/Arc/MetJ family transcriptional regulator